MKRLVLSLFALLLTLMFIKGTVPQKADDHFQKQWEEVISLKEKGLPQSALKIVDNIYNQAKKQKNQQQIVKALLYRISLKSTFEEEYQPKAIAAFEKELKIAPEPRKSILYSLLAQMYRSYYTQNRYKILNRSVVENLAEDDIQTWDARRFQEKIKRYYALSTANKKLLKSVSLKDYAQILTTDKKEAFRVWPVLYDLLAQRAIDYFSSSDAALFDFSKNSLDTNYLTPVRDFVKIDFPEKNMDNKTEVLRLFKEVLQYHLKNKDTTALVDADLKRLSYVKEHITDKKAGAKDYAGALKSLLDDVRSSEAIMPVAYALAEYYYTTATVDKVNDKAHKNLTNLVKAEQICKDALKSQSRSKWREACLGLIEKIHRPSLYFQLAAENEPARPVLVQCSYKNVKKLYVKVVPTRFEINPQNWQQQQKKMEKLSKQKGAYNTTFDLPDRGDYREHTADLELPSFPVGQYVVFMSDTITFSKKKTLVFKQIEVTSLSYLLKINSVNDVLDVYVLDRESGKTVDNADITVYKQEYDRHSYSNKAIKIGDYRTDKNGFARISADAQWSFNKLLFHFSKNNDNYYAYTQSWYWRGNREDKPVVKTWLFTDRAIYRPGQTVYFKGIVTKKSEKETVVIKGEQVSVQLLDANYKNLSTLELRTNTFGSVQGSFVLPTGKLNGRFTLRTKNGSATFKVEEYKRPTFRVEFDTLSEKYRLNDAVTVKGNAADYAGSPLTGAKVQFRVTRKPSIINPYFWRYIPYPQANREVEIAQGQLLTGDDGTFVVTFKAVPDEDQPLIQNWYFTVSVDVTDVTGEVHSDRTVVPIGKNPFVLTIETENKIDREQEKGITVSAKNLSGKAVDVDATLQLYSLTPPQHLLTSRLWNKSDTLLISKEKFQKDFPHRPYGNEDNREKWPKEEVVSLTIHITGSGNFLANALKNLAPGEYLIAVKSTTEAGLSIEDKRFVTLYSEKSKAVPVHSVLWFTTTKTVAEPGETLKILLGSAAKNSRVLLEIFSGRQQIKEEWITLGKRQKVIELPIEESYRGNVVVKVSTIRFNSSFSNLQLIQVPFSNKKLNITLETHRDYLTPGKKEEWRVNIKGYKGEKVAAELLTTMYDASLDQFATNRWNMKLFYPKPPASTWNTDGFSIARGRILFQPEIKYYSVPAILYPQINWFGYRMGFGGRTFNKVMGIEMAAPKIAGQSPGIPVTGQGLKKQPAYDGNKPPTPPAELEKPEKKEFQYRTNFNETAFFYPQLHTDSLGNVSFSFTTPDALTEWKLMMLAHTVDLQTGTLVQKIKAHKELMVLPNKPRFVRAGDMLDFSGKVVNFTGKAMHANVTIEFFNPMDNTPLAILKGKSKANLNMQLPAGKSMGFSQKITVPQGIDLMAFRIKAVSENFTDGVEDMLPVLPDKMLVTETMPMTVKGNSTKTFRFDKLINTGKTMQASAVDNYRYTVEFSSHPVWYAVQALPYLAQPRYESAQNLFNRYYANTIASGIVNKYPKIKTVLEQWKNSSPDAFLSNLQKNQALKSVLLDATPWVLEAESETEQKRRIALLFDVNNLSNALDESLRKIEEMQLSSGAWSWFKGMYEDRYVTQSIVTGFARLRKMEMVNLADNRGVSDMLQKAIYYLDNQITKDYNSLKKQKNVSLGKKHIGSLQIQYLYARTAFVDVFPVKDKNREAYDYYTGQARRYWLKQNNYLQAMTAVVMERMNMRNEAEGIIRSLTERSLESEELGMYWRSETGWFWYQAPVETEVMIMEAYDEVMHDRQSVEKMKIWLLKNKETNRWKTTSATADAVFGLLMRGDDLLNETKNVEITLGGKPLKPDAGEPQAGTGFIQKSRMHKEIKPEMGIIKITNPNHSIAWGAAYYQYFETLDKIGVHQTVLQVHKKFFVEKLTDEGPVVEPLLPDKVLKTGQKIVVRLVIKTDRDMEYIHLKDMRAAALEPVKTLSGTQFKGGLMFYENIKDASVDFFISRLPKGTHVLEYSLRVTQKGSFSNGIATIQSLYAPEFAAHSQGWHIRVE